MKHRSAVVLAGLALAACNGDAEGTVAGHREAGMEFNINVP